MSSRAMKWRWIAAAAIVLLPEPVQARQPQGDALSPPLKSILYGSPEPFESETTLLDEAFDLGRLALSTKSYDEAEKSFQLVLREAGRLATQDDRHVEALLWLSLAEVRLGKSREALRDGDRALELIEKAHGSRNLSWAVALNALGKAMAEAGMKKHPYECYRNVMEIYENAGGPDHGRVAEVALRLARIDSVRSDDVRAEELARKALAILEKSRSENLYETANGWHLLGLSCRNQGKLAEAESCFQRALGIVEKIEPVNHGALAISLTNLGYVIHLRGRDTEAEPLLVRASEILAKESYSIDSCKYFVNYGMAQILEDRKKYAEAERYYRKVLEIVERNCGLDHPELLVSLDKLAALLRRQGRTSEAETTEGRARAIRKKGRVQAQGTWIKTPWVVDGLLH